MNYGLQTLVLATGVCWCVLVVGGACNAGDGNMPPLVAQMVNNVTSSSQANNKMKIKQNVCGFIIKHYLRQMHF